MSLPLVSPLSLEGLLLVHGQSRARVLLVKETEVRANLADEATKSQDPFKS